MTYIVLRKGSERELVNPRFMAADFVFMFIPEFAVVNYGFEYFYGLNRYVGWF